MIALASILGLLGACEKRPPVEVPSRLVLTPVSYSELPGWAEDGQAEALPAFLRSCGRLERQPDARAVGPGGLGGRVADWRPACAALAQVSDDTPRTRLRARIPAKQDFMRIGESP